MINTKDVLVKKLMRKEEMKAYQVLEKLRLNAMRKLRKKSRIGDKKVSHFRSYVNLKKIFTAWKRFRDEKMGQECSSPSLSPINL